MIFGLRDGALLPFVPLLIGALALGVREATRRVDVSPESHARATPFVVPSALSALGRSPGIEETYAIDEQESRAIWSVVGASESSLLRVTGSVRVLADDTLAQLELDVSAPARRPASTLPGFVATQRTNAVCRHSHVPNAHTCTLVCQASLLGEARDLRFEAAWMRLPGGTLRLQAVTEIDELPARIAAAASAPWGRAPRASVSLDLVLQRSR